VESKSLSSPPASIVSIASHCSSSSPSPSSFTFSTVHVACEKWRAAHHQPLPFPPPAPTLLLLLRLLYSPLSKEEQQKQSTTEHIGEQLPQLTIALHHFQRQSLLFLFLFPFLFPFSFSFSFVFCMLHYSWMDWVRPKPKCPVSGSDLVK